MMKNVIKIEYIAAILLGVGIFNSCTQRAIEAEEDMQNRSSLAYMNSPLPTMTGSYLAGRIAHMRQDLNKAADYYAKAVDMGCKESEIVARTYLLLAFEGRVDEAHRYAQQAAANGDKNYIIHFLNMAYFAGKGNFAQAAESLEGIEEEVYKKAIFPPMLAWIAAGEGNYQKALDALEPLRNDQFQTLYYMHAGLINEYFGKFDKAFEIYDKVVNDKNIELSFRSLQLISDSYARHGRVEQAQDTVRKYLLENGRSVTISGLSQNLEQVMSADGNRIDTPQKGLAEALFNMGTAFRSYQGEVAQVFNMLALYLNPKHDIARVSVADLLESSGQIDKACQEYAKISTSSPIYFMAGMKLASLYMSQEDHEKALAQLKKMDKQYPDNYQILFNLGEVYRVIDNQTQAIKLYKRALKFLPEDNKNDWTVLYALGLAYERNNDFSQAEDVMQKALELSNRHPVVLNYLGYSWLKNNKNPNEALFMIFEAYHQSPEDAYVMDSLGWALFKMGKYEEAAKILERAAEYLPDNAIICDHLGDAYWQTGRKNEAQYQWKHALKLKDDTKEIDPKNVRSKIENGMDKPIVIQFNEALLVERLKALDVNP